MWTSNDNKSSLYIFSFRSNRNLKEIFALVGKNLPNKLRVIWKYDKYMTVDLMITVYVCIWTWHVRSLFSLPSQAECRSTRRHVNLPGSPPPLHHAESSVRTRVSETTCRETVPLYTQTPGSTVKVRKHVTFVGSSTICIEQ